jgi:putative oxidoreductase
MRKFFGFAYEFVPRWALPFKPIASALARVTVGWVFVTTGWGKLNNLPDIVAYFAELGIPYPELQAPFVATIELVCGALVLAGLFTRLASIPLIGTMIVAIATAQWPQVDSLATLLGLVESLYIVVFAYLATDGAGPLSLDALVKRAVDSHQSEVAQSTLAAAPLPRRA